MDILYKTAEIVTKHLDELFLSSPKKDICWMNGKAALSQNGWQEYGGEEDNAHSCPWDQSPMLDEGYCPGKLTANTVAPRGFYLHYLLIWLDKLDTILQATLTILM